MPAAAITSASPSLAQVMPMAPAASCIRASVGHLCVLACGRRRTGLSRKVVGHALDVGLDRLDVQAQRRGVELGFGRADE